MTHRSVPPAALLDASPDALFVVRADATLVYANPATVELMGYRLDQFLGRSVLDLVHPDDLPLVLSSLIAVQGKEIGTPVELRVMHADNTWRWVEIIGRDATGIGEVGGIVCGARDLTKRRMWEVAGDDVVRFQQVVQHASSIVLLLDAAGVIASVNGAFTRLLGHDPSIAVGRPLTSFVVGPEQRALSQAIEGAGRSRTTSVEVSMRPSDGGTALPVRFEIVNLLDDPVVAGFVVTGHDVSDLHEAQRRLEHLASHDALTGLPNRSLLHHRLSDLLAARAPLALLYVDLDRFKPVNDKYGHEAGDELLRFAAERLLGATDSNDLVSRVGGDEFVVLALGIGERASAAALATRLERLLSQPFALQSGLVSISASVGFAMAAANSTPATLLSEADHTMYASKSLRRAASD